jgi:hypothetical protein
MATSTASAANGTAITTKSTFRRTTSVAIRVNAKPDILWAMLTNADDFPRWNSTVTSIEGPIAQGNTIKVKVKIDAKRVFKLKVNVFEHKSRMTWEQGMAPFFKGVRTYTLTPNSDVSTTFAMEETMGGLMFPMAAGSIPDFKAPFEQYAADVKKEAELIAKAK